MNQVDSVAVGRVQTVIMVKCFKGTVPIQSLDIFPLKYHSDANGLKEMLLKRGRKWVELTGVHHKQYSGIAALKLGDKIVKHNVSAYVSNFRASLLKYIFARSRAGLWSMEVCLS